MFVNGLNTLASGSGHWTLGIPTGDAIAIDDPDMEGLYPAVQMTLDLTPTAAVSFAGPPAPSPADSVGFTATFDLKLVNDTGVALNGLTLNLNMLDPKLPLSLVPGVIQFGDLVNANYAYFTAIQPGSFAGETTTLIGPDGLITTPTGTAASELYLGGMIAPGATIEGNFTIHNTELPTGSNDFTMTVGAPSTDNFAITDTTSSQSYAANGTLYKGQVPGLQDQIIMATPDNINVAALKPNVFIHTGSGNDAIDVSEAGGSNVLDGSTGSNFLVGGVNPIEGDDTFYIDDRNPSADIWSTIKNFHSGDNATIWGITPADFNIVTLDGQGAVGNTGLTWQITAAGKPNANITLAEYTSADLADGKLTVSFGTSPDTPGLPGSPYMLIHGT